MELNQNKIVSLSKVRFVLGDTVDVVFDSKAGVWRPVGGELNMNLQVMCDPLLCCSSHKPLSPSSSQGRWRFEVQGLSLPKTLCWDFFS